MVSVFGIRHHRPGSARSLNKALDELQPDCILVEGPPEGEPILSLVAHEEMKPPVAMLIYAPDKPQKAVYYPFAIFSPEWQALSFAAQKSIPVRFMDLPQTHWLAMKDDEPNGASDENAEGDKEQGTAPDTAAQTGDESMVREDPLRWLAQAAGYSDGERWWEHMVEQRTDSTELFTAIQEAIGALRAEMPERNDKFEPYREAHMRNTIRATQKEGFQNIAVVCGAWHAPALQDMPKAKDDAALLKGLPKLKVECTWIPWTHGRLSYLSGYGAGVTSPGWYQHLWTATDRIIERWMARVARLLREEDLDASSAHIIEAVRLAESLAALRGRPLPGLTEVTESVQSVLCFGNNIPMRLIHEKLIVGEVLGAVPQCTPSVPLERDLKALQKRLRMPAEAAEKIYDLDLRKENDLERSRLLHRLSLLGLPWGRLQKQTGKGTFHEVWQVRWLPEFSLQLIEAGKWGRTVGEAASACAHDVADKATELSVLTALLDQVLLAELGEAAAYVMQKVQNLAALVADIGHLMDAIPPLVNVARYGSVRKTDEHAVEHVLDGLLARTCVGLPGACSALSDDAAQPMFDRIARVHSSVGLMQRSEHTEQWQDTLLRLLDSPGIHGLLAGRACRLLLESRAIDAQQAARRLGLVLSIATAPIEAANWAEGFLRGSGLVLIHDEVLWNVIDAWVCDLKEEAFTQILPLLRRTFSTFQPAEKRQMGERVAHGGLRKFAGAAGRALDEQRGDLVLPVLSQILGLE